MSPAEALSPLQGCCRRDPPPAEFLPPPQGFVAGRNQGEQRGKSIAGMFRPELLYLSPPPTAALAADRRFWSPPPARQERIRGRERERSEGRGGFGPLLFIGCLSPLPSLSMVPSSSSPTAAAAPSSSQPPRLYPFFSPADRWPPLRAGEHESERGEMRLGPVRFFLTSRVGESVKSERVA